LAIKPGSGNGANGMPPYSKEGRVLWKSDCSG